MTADEDELALLARPLDENLELSADERLVLLDVVGDVHPHHDLVARDR